MKKQKTFEYGGLATDWLCKLSECFEIKRATILKVQVKGRFRKENRWRVEVDYE